MKHAIETDKAPAAIGAYSQAIAVGDLVFLSGQIGLVPETMKLVSTDFQQQAQQVFENLSAVTKAAGVDLSAIVKLTIYLTSMDHYAVLNEVMAQYWQEPYPARAVVAVTALPKAADIEIDAIIVK